MYSFPSTAAIAGIGACVPSKVIQSSDLSFNSEAEKQTFINKIGIKERRLSGGVHTSADLCFHAAISVMELLDWEPESIDLLISVTQSPDYFVPGNALLLQSRLNLKASCLVLDINAGCTGWIQGLLQCIALANLCQVNRALILTGETSILSHKSQQQSYRLMGDAGVATAINCHLNVREYFFSAYNYGNLHDVIFSPGSGARYYSEMVQTSTDNDDKVRYDHTVKMDGVQVQDFISSKVIPSVSSFLNEVPITPDWYVFHQPNKLHFDFMIKKLGLDPLLCPSVISSFGNISSASIPLSIHQMYFNSNKAASNLSCHAFGVGLSTTNIAFRADQIICSPMVEI